MGIKKIPEPMLAAVFLAGVGAVAMFRSWQYGVGSAAMPGTGYFPFIVSIVMTFLALIVAWREWRARASSQILLAWPWRSLGFITAALLVFWMLMGGARGWGIPSGGLLFATFSLVVLSSRAGPSISWKETLILAIFLSGLAWLVFVQLLGMSVPLWP